MPQMKVSCSREGLLVHHPADLPIEIPGVLFFATACFTIVITFGPDGFWRTRPCGSFMIRRSSAATPSSTARFSFIRLL
ncbi:hypothetical protein M2189_005462 [Bradyrhizobium japonicum]|uniref:hypothetical protein n=1 Tax=Bradyrhizobium japonicum TaxID=375 RepID=UPI0021699090|nr:hypothetical protein [Bradyrhizobium japonicum]MCS3495579.1 hypothetical protein [Bradyrhizobium japonicum]MCS3962259.1 hypothetical protein [Bradyrhizobium japonicum]MCS3994576.1 hypothetical protein [Bradyrhizobium japonicum]